MLGGQGVYASITFIANDDLYRYITAAFTTAILLFCYFSVLTTLTINTNIFLQLVQSRSFNAIATMSVPYYRGNQPISNIKIDLLNIIYYRSSKFRVTYDREILIKNLLKITNRRTCVNITSHEGLFILPCSGPLSMPGKLCGITKGHSHDVYHTRRFWTM